MYCLRNECRGATPMKETDFGYQCIDCGNKVDLDGLRLGTTREEILTRVLRYDLTLEEKAAMQRLYNEHKQMKAALVEIDQVKDTEFDSGDLIALFKISEKGLKGIV